MKFNRKLCAIISVVLTLSVVVAIFVSTGIFASAEEYDEVDPEFMEARINSDVELEYSVKTAYTQTTEFSQGEGKYSIKTDAYVVWYTSDDVAFLYRQYNIGDTREDVLTVETTVLSQGNANAPAQGIYETASSGLMMRGSVEDASSASIFLHTRATGVDVVYRTENGSITYHGPSGILPEYPVKLKIEKEGNKYTCYFQNKSMSSYVKIGSYACKIEGPIYAGLASHCSDPAKPIYSQFSGYTAKGQGTCDTAGGGAESTTPTKPVIEPLKWEDAPYDETDTLLYETFSDGEFNNGEESVSNPIWQETEAYIVTNEEKTNRYLKSSYTDETLMLGSQYWTDYWVSMDYSIADGVSSGGDDRVALWTRFKDIDPYGYYGIGFVIETDFDEESKTTTTYLRAYSKYQINQKGTDVCGDKVAEAKIDSQTGTGWHTLKVECFDNTFTAYLDGTQVLTYLDETQSPRLRGQIGIGTHETEVCFDNIIVKKMHDEFGGDYDNYIGANYDQKIPEYIAEFMGKYEIVY